MKTAIKTLLLFLLLFISLGVFPQIVLQRVDPPFWWTGMEETKLQLMFYGKGLAESEPALSYPGVELTGVSRLENPDYLVIDLNIKEEARPGKIAISFQYQRELLFVVDYELKAREKGSAEREGFDKEDVIYLIMPDRFSNGDPANDTVEGMFEAADRSNPDGRHGGDLKGIGDKLDYLAELGITALWLNPVLENNMPAKSYHGYAITDFYRVDPRFGTNEDYRAFVDNCHKKELKVIMDMVFNHCGSNHFWINDLPSNDWIHRFPEFTRSNFRIEAAIDPYASDFDLQRMQTGWFDKTMPDLDQRNAFLANYLVQNSIWWIEYAGLDGIRMDTYPYSYKDFMENWLGRIRREYPDFSVVGETWLQKEMHTAFFQSDSPASNNHIPQLSYLTDFPLHYALRDAFTEKEGWTSGLARLYYVLSQDIVYADPFCNLIFADNHDLTRFYTSIGGDYNKFKMAMAVLLTTRGIPLIYYGTEYLMTGEEPKGHGYIREDFPGGSWQEEVGSQESSVVGRQSSVVSQKGEGLEYLKKLLNWRKGADVIHHGKLKQFVPDGGIYVYSRYDEDDAVMVILNKNPEEKALDLKRFNEVIKDYHEGKDVVTGKTFVFEETLAIPPETALILELN
jgi:neopullulanase